ncbi:MAG: 30S ribosomal protein S1 [Planctomycetota bacterium]
MANPNDIDPSLEAEIEAQFNDLGSMEDLMAEPAPTEGQEPQRKGYEPGERIRAKVLTVGRDDIFVDLGPRFQGVISREHYPEEGEIKAPAEGEEVDLRVIRYDRSEGLFYLAPVHAAQKAEWETLEIGQVVEARCTGTNKGGLVMEVAGHRAFMPAGQIDRFRVENLDECVNQQYVCEVIEFNRKTANIVLSRREVQERERREAKDRIWKELEVGQDVEGIVRKIMPFGAFVDLGGVDGLIHISDLAYERVNKADEVVKEGEKVTVRVLKLDPDNERIGLGLKQRQADPFESVNNTVNEGDVVSGKVTRITTFGAFVELQPGVEGLVHISQLAHERVNRVSQVVSEGEIVQVKVLEVDPESRRIGLSIKALKEQQAEEAERPEDKAMAKLKARFGGGDKNLKGGIE